MLIKAHAALLSNSALTTANAVVCAGALANVMRNLPHFRGKARLQQWLLPSRGIRQANVFGCRMELDLSDVIQRDMYAGMYEPFEAMYLKRYLRPGMQVVDVGANIGYYTWMASSCVGPQGRVFSFEPGPYAFERLERVIRENGVKNVECRRVALSDRAGRATLYVPQKDAGNYNPSFSQYLPDMLAVDVAVERLDDALPRAGVSQVDFMKVDVEGHELEVFRGGEEWIRQGRIKSVLCELNEDSQRGVGSTSASLEGWLLDAGFRVAEVFPSKWGDTVHNRLYVWG